MVLGKSMLVVPFVLLFFTGLLYQSMLFSGLGEVDVYGSNVTVGNETDVSGGLWENSTESGVELEGYSLTAGFDPLYGAIAIVVGSLAVAILAGVKVLGSGLSDFTVKMIVKVAVFYSFWILVSMFAVNAFALFPLGFGWLIYLLMTLMYGFGVMEET